MQMRQKLIIHSIYFLLGFALFLEFIQCNKPDDKGNVAYGKSFFITNCASCHQRSDGYKNAPSIIALNNYDSLTLLKKLSYIQQDSVHIYYFKTATYSNKEINSIYKYIKSTLEPHY
jgi:mono/diheme cytochrome c family protein